MPNEPREAPLRVTHSPRAATDASKIAQLPFHPVAPLTGCLNLPIIRIARRMIASAILHAMVRSPLQNLRADPQTSGQSRQVGKRKIVKFCRRRGQ